jgi:CheY-like chemotaxis protein
MPVMSGFELIEALSPQLSNFISKSKIILLSSSVDPRDIEKAANYPTIIEFAPKPLTVDYLQKLLTIN